MTADEVKSLLLSGETEGADRSGIYDKVVSEFAALSQRSTELNQKITKLTDQVGTLTDNNFKLLEKIRYAEDTTGKDENGNQGADETAPITLENLFDQEG